MEVLNQEFSRLLRKNMAISIIYFLYTAVVAGIMAYFQSGAPYNNVRSYFNNTFIFLAIVIVQLYIILSEVYSRKKGEAQSRNTLTFLANVLYGAAFSALGSLISVWSYSACLKHFSGENISRLFRGEAYYYGMELNSLHFNELFKLWSYGFMFILSLLAILYLVSSLKFAARLGIFIIFSAAPFYYMFNKSKGVAIMSKFFTTYGYKNILYAVLGGCIILFFGAAFYLQLRSLKERALTK